MSVGVEFDVDGVRYLNLGLNAVLRYLGDTRSLMQQLGTAVESQTKRRIADEKRAPNGRPWVPWSPDYAATRHAGHSLLVNEGHLLNSITWGLVGNDAVQIGTRLEYGARHQFGIGVPARPFLDTEFEDLGNRQEVELILKDWIDGANSVAALYGGGRR